MPLFGQPRAVNSAMRPADLPWDEQAAILGYNALRPLVDWSQERRTGLQTLAGPAVHCG
jgi:hypothetical protein